jgi:hypothetical protein
LPDIVEYYDENFDPQTGMGGIEIWVPVKLEIDPGFSTGCVYVRNQ